MLLLQRGLGGLELRLLVLLGATWAVVSDDDLVVPCSNFREVMAPRGAGCRKRMLEVPTSTVERNDLARRIEALRAAGPTEPWMNQGDWAMLSPIMLPIRVGLTASITGSRGNVGVGEHIERALQDWAVSTVTNQLRLWTLYPLCLEICLEDDMSDKRTALRIYRRFANPGSGYDVDILLGPATSDFKEDVAVIAKRFDKLLVLWSYDGSHYDHGLGSTHGRLGSVGVTGERVLVKLARNLPRRTTGEALVPYVNYTAPGLTGITSNSSGSDPTWDDETFLLPGKEHPVVVFRVRDKLGDKPLDSDPLVAEGEWPSATGTEGTEVIALSRPPSDGRVNYTYSNFGMELEVDFRLERNMLVAHWAESFLAYKASLDKVVDDLRQTASSAGIKPPIHDIGTYLNHGGVSRTMGVESFEYSWMQGASQDVFEALKTRPQGDSVWRVEGPCVVDAADCLTSPRYPDKYNSERCFAIASDTETSARLVMTEFDTEAFHDTLLLNGEFYYGHDIELGAIELEGSVVELQWYPDDSRHGSGWRICPDSAILDNCLDFVCPVGLRHKPDYSEVSCAGHCNAQECCTEALMDVDGAIWNHGYTNLIDVTVPRSRWALEPLARLKERGATFLLTVLTGMPDTVSLRRCQRTQDLAREELGYSVVSETVRVVDWTFPSDNELVNDAFFELAADVLLLCGDMMTVGLFLTMEDSRHVNYNATVLAQPFGKAFNDIWQGLSHYVIEPLPWPSPLWIWENFPISELPSTVADLQVQSVGQLLSAAVPLLPVEESAVWPSLNVQALHEILLSMPATRTHLGDISFEPSGKRAKAATASARQFFPLRAVTGITPKVAWDYLQARSMFAELYILADDMARIDELSDIYSEQFDNRYRALEYPAPVWQHRKAAVYPCPLGCVSTGFACAPCPPGQVRGLLEDHCAPCPWGTLATRYGLSTCQSCPRGSTCSRGPDQQPLALVGWWDGAQLHEQREQAMDICSAESGLFPDEVKVEHEDRLFLPCDPLLLCIGGTPEEACWGNNTGVLCRSCKPGHSWQYFGSGRRVCVECPSRFVVMFFYILPILVLFLVLMLLWERAGIQAAMETSSLVCPIIKLGFHHFTIFNVIMEGMNLDRLVWLPNVWDVLTRPQEVAFYDCVAVAPYGEGGSLNEIFAALGFCGAGLACVLCLLLVRTSLLQGRLLFIWCMRLLSPPEMSHSCWRYQVIQAQQRMWDITSSALRQTMIWATMCLPILARAGAVSLDQRTIGGECRVSKFLDIACESEVYQFWVYPASQAVVFVALFAPVLLAWSIYRRLGEFQQMEVRLYMAPFIHGYKQGLELCEVGFFIRMVVVVLSLSQQPLARMVTIFAALACNEAIQIRLQPFVPQERQMLARYERLSFRILMMVLCVGAAFSFASDLSIAGVLQQQEDALSERGLFTIIARSEYEVTIFTMLLNGLLLISAVLCIIYNQVIIPNAVRIISGDRAEVSQCLSRLIASLQFHAVRLDQEEDGGFTMNVGSLTDGERMLLADGIFQSMLTCLHVNDTSFSMLNVMNVLQMALQRAGSAHQARWRVYKEKIESQLRLSSTSGILRIVGFRRQSYWERRKSRESAKKGRRHGLRKEPTLVTMDVEPSLASPSTPDGIKHTHVDVLVDELYSFLRDVHVDIAAGHPSMNFLHHFKAEPKQQAQPKAAARRRVTSTTMEEGDEFSTWCVGDEATAPKEQRMRPSKGEDSGMLEDPQAGGAPSPSASAVLALSKPADVADPAPEEAPPAKSEDVYAEVTKEMEKLEAFQETDDERAFRHRLLNLRIEAASLRKKWRESPEYMQEDNNKGKARRSGLQKKLTKDSSRPGSRKSTNNRPEASRTRSCELGGELDRPWDDTPMAALEDVPPERSGNKQEIAEIITLQKDLEVGNKDMTPLTGDLDRQHEEHVTDPLPPPPGPPPPGIAKVAFYGMKWPGKAQGESKRNSSSGDSSILAIGTV